MKLMRLGVGGWGFGGWEIWGRFLIFSLLLAVLLERLILGVGDCYGISGGEILIAGCFLIISQKLLSFL